MTKSDTVTSYLTRVSQVHDDLGAVGEKVEQSELVMKTLNVFSKPWDNFAHVIVSRENLLDWVRLWDDFILEDLRLRGCSSIL